jgi:uncharacterized protein YjbJ (UPF0337 family)
VSKRLELPSGTSWLPRHLFDRLHSQIFDHAAVAILGAFEPKAGFPRFKGCSQTCSTFHHTEAEMDWNRVEGSWKQLKGKIKEQWGNLTDDDIEKIAGKREQLEGKIQERYGTSRSIP